MRLAVGWNGRARGQVLRICICISICMYLLRAADRVSHAKTSCNARLLLLARWRGRLELSFAGRDASPWAAMGPNHQPIWTSWMLLWDSCLSTPPSPLSPDASASVQFTCVACFLHADLLTALFSLSLSLSLSILAVFLLFLVAPEKDAEVQVRELKRGIIFRH